MLSVQNFGGRDPIYLGILFVGQFSFTDTNNGFFFHDLLEGLESAAGTGSRKRTVQALEFFCQFDPGIWIQYAVMEELIFKLTESDSQWVGRGLPG